MFLGAFGFRVEGLALTRPGLQNLRSLLALMEGG